MSTETFLLPTLMLYNYICYMNLYFASQKSEKLNIEQSISYSTTSTSCPYNCQRVDDRFKTAVIAKKRSQHMHIF